MKKIIASFALTGALFSGTAMSADVKVAPAAFDWTGFYLGAQAGGAFFNDSVTEYFTASGLPSGFNKGFISNGGGKGVGRGWVGGSRRGEEVESEAATKRWSQPKHRTRRPSIPSGICTLHPQTGHVTNSGMAPRRTPPLASESRAARKSLPARTRSFASFYQVCRQVPGALGGLTGPAVLLIISGEFTLYTGHRKGVFVRRGGKFLRSVPN